MLHPRQGRGGPQRPPRPCRRCAGADRRTRWLCDTNPCQRLDSLRVVDGADKSIPTPRQRLDEARRLGRIAQRVAQPVDHGVQAVVEVDERATRPEPLAQLFTRDQVARSLQQQREDLERLLLKPDADASLPQLAGLQIQLEDSEPDHAEAVLRRALPWSSLQKALRMYRRILTPVQLRLSTTAGNSGHAPCEEPSQPPVGLRLGSRDTSDLRVTSRSLR